MDKISAKYFDGKTSKPQVVLIEKFKRDIVIYNSTDSKDLIARWKIESCKTENFNDSNSLQISYGNGFPRQLIEIEDPSEVFINAFTANNIGEKYLFDFVLKRNAFKIILTGIIVLTVLIFSYVNWISVYVGNAIVSIIPLNVEESIGEKAYNQYNPILDIDAEKSEILNEFYTELGFHSKYNIETYYDSNKMVNAFALPGGKIIVYRGLINKTESWQELAALFSHELTHINERHSLRLMARQIGNYAVFSAITGDMAGISSVMIESAISLHELVNSRAYEQEADKLGLQILVEKEIEPNAMIDLFQRLLNENKEVEEFMGDYVEELELLSTHPLTKKRMQYIDDWISKNITENFEVKENTRAEELWKRLKE